VTGHPRLRGPHGNAPTLEGFAKLRFSRGPAGCRSGSETYTNMFVRTTESRSFTGCACGRWCECTKKATLEVRKVPYQTQQQGSQASAGGEKSSEEVAHLRRRMQLCGRCYCALKMVFFASSLITTAFWHVQARQVLLQVARGCQRVGMLRPQHPASAPPAPRAPSPLPPRASLA